MMKKRGFTLIELIVVISMLMILMGSVTSAVAKARTRAKIAATTASVNELTKAINAYNNYGRAGEDALLDKARGGWIDASESTLGFVIGNEAMPDGVSGNVVLYNGTLKDAWGRYFRFRIEKGDTKVEDGLLDASLRTNIYIPNFYRNMGGN